MQTILSSALMVLVGLLTALLAKRRWQIQWKWLGCGALLWAVAVGLKFIISALINRPVLLTLKGHFIYPLFLLFGATYIGLLTSLTEVLLVLVAGRRWRQMTYDARRGIGIGLGAGAIEAIGLGVVGPFLLGGMSGSGLSVAILLPAIERLLCIPSHAAVRAMTLYAVAATRWRWFWGAFAMFTAIDGAAGFYHLHRRSSIGYLVSEVCLITSMVISLFLLRYLWKHWPAPSGSQGGAHGGQPLGSESKTGAALSKS